MFSLHPQLKSDLIFLKKLELSQVLLYPDKDNPWVVLVPEVENVAELHQLSSKDQLRLLKEINYISSLFEKEFKPDKLNIGALGNMVSQLHIHIICRFINDKAWPNAIWGSLKNSHEELKELKQKILKIL